MPSSTPKQAKLMRAIAHGWHKPGGGPSVQVAKDFMKADEAKGKYEHSRHRHSAKSWKSSTPFKDHSQNKYG